MILVDVTNNQFTPSNFSANPGDVIRFTWVAGFHSTTSDIIPAGASTWDQFLTGPGQTYDYTVTIPGSYSYYCTVHGRALMSATFTVNAAAPVKLTSFSVKGSGKGTAVLNWQTVTEENADYFSIQRSENGKDFHELGRLKAAGNSVLPLNYSFTDNTTDPSARYYYYQLLTVDLDKKEERSKIILFRQDVKVRTIIVKLSPNPVSSGDHLQLWFNADQQGNLKASIYDVSGKRVYESNLSAYPGVNFGHLHIHELQAGMYVLKLSVGKLKESVTFTVQ